MRKPNYFKLIRRRRGWTVTDILKRCPSVKDQQWRNLESGVATPHKLQARTVGELVECFYPDLQFRHFVHDTRLELRRVRGRPR